MKTMRVIISGLLPSGMALPIGYAKAFNKIVAELNALFEKKGQAFVRFNTSANSDDSISVDLETEVEFPLELTTNKDLKKIITGCLRDISDKEIEFSIKPNSWFVLLPEKKIDTSVHLMD